MALRTKAEVIEVVKGIIEAKVGKITKKEAKEIVEDLAKAVVAELEKGDEVILPEVGKLKVVETAARKGRNPHTGEEIDIPAGKRVKFSPTKALKEAVKK